jgi:WD40 repeat protein
MYVIKTINPRNIILLCILVGATACNGLFIPRQKKLLEIGTGQYQDIDGETIAFNNNGKILALANYDGIRLYDTASGILLNKLSNNDIKIWNIAYRGNRDELASVSEYGEVRIWNINEANEFRVLREPKGKVAPWLTATGVAYSADGTRLIAWINSWDDDEKAVIIWNTSSWECVASINTYQFNSAGVSPDGQTIIVTDDSGWKIINITTQTITLQNVEGDPVSYAVFSPDGNYIYTTNWLTGQNSLWDAKTGNRLFTFGECEGGCRSEGPMDAYLRLGISDDNSRLVGINVFPINKVNVWDTKNMEIVYSFEKGRFIRDVAISKDGKIVAALVKLSNTNEDGMKIYLWYL